MEYTKPVDEDKMNKHMSDILKQNIDSADASGSDVKEIAHDAPPSGSHPTDMFKGDLMTFTQMLEALQVAERSIGYERYNEDVMDAPMEQAGYNEEEALKELSALFTPTLVMQNYEKEIADKSLGEVESAGVLTERTVIKFDDEARMAQLIAVAARIIAKQKDTEAWKLYKQASILKKKADLDLQKQEYDSAKDLAQKYLMQVSTTNPSSVARQAADELLPQTRH